MKIREQLITFNVHKIALPIVRIFTPPQLVTYSIQELAQLPTGTLGKDLHFFLTNNNIQLLPHFQTHDIKHVLLNYSISDRDEACMQFFYLGNRHYSIATFLTVFSSIFMMPEFWPQFHRAFRRGKNTEPIGHLTLEKMLLIPTEEIRIKYHIKS